MGAADDSGPLIPQQYLVIFRCRMRVEVGGVGTLYPAVRVVPSQGSVIVFGPFLL